MTLLGKYETLQKVVASSPGAVAFSGGADSSLLLKVVVDVFGPGSLAFFADSELQTDADRANAVRTARIIGANLRIVELNPTHWPDFAANSPERCYICKKKVYLLFKGLLPKKDMALLDGSNLDDLKQDRPGRRAIAELDVKTPLVEAGLSKDDVRRLGEFVGVPSWNRESASCLATRIPTGTMISSDNLRRVARYEKILTDYGLCGARIRLCADDLRSVGLELKKSDMTSIWRTEIKKKLVQDLEKSGIENIWLSLKGR